MAEVIKILMFVDVVIVFPVLLGIIVIDSFKILRVMKRVKVTFSNLLFYFACVHTILLIFALIKV